MNFARLATDFAALPLRAPLALLVLASTLSAGQPEVFFAEDVSEQPPDLNQVPRPPLPNSRKAAAAFRARLTGATTESFESFEPNDDSDRLTFGRTFGTLAGERLFSEIENPADTEYGAFPTTGNRFLLLSSGRPEINGAAFFTVTFSAPQTAIGFFVNDIEINRFELVFLRLDGTRLTHAVPVTVPQGSAGGAYFGLIDEEHPFSGVEFRNVGSISDAFGFDDLTIGSPEQVIPSEETSSFADLDPLASVAMIGFGNLAEIKREREYLSESGWRSSSVPPKDATFENLKGYSLAIWCGVGRTSVSTDEIMALSALRRSGRPLYFIGEHLASAAAGLSAPDQLLWQSLVQLSTTPFPPARGPLELLPARRAYIPERTNRLDFLPERGGFESARAEAEAEAVFRAGQADAVVLFPRADHPGLESQPRTVTQNFFVFGADATAANSGRRQLFQDLVCWLLHCQRCVPFSAELETGPVDLTATLGETLELQVTLSENYGCHALGMVLEAVLPHELAWLEATPTRGTPRIVDQELSWILGEMSSEERATIRFRVKALAAGSVSFSVRASSYESIALAASNQRTFAIRINPTFVLPRLELARNDGSWILEWPASARDWTLFSSPECGPRARWNRVEGPRSILGERVRQFVPVGNRREFFRLAR